MRSSHMVASAWTLELSSICVGRFLLLLRQGRYPIFFLEMQALPWAIVLELETFSNPNWGQHLGEGSVIRTKNGAILLIAVVALALLCWDWVFSQTQAEYEDKFVKVFMKSLIEETPDYKSYLARNDPMQDMALATAKKSHWLTDEYNIVGAQRNFPGTEYHLRFASGSSAILYLEEAKDGKVRKVTIDVFSPPPSRK